MNKLELYYVVPIMLLKLTLDNISLLALTPTFTTRSVSVMRRRHGRGIYERYHEKIAFFMRGTPISVTISPRSSLEKRRSSMLLRYRISTTSVVRAPFEKSLSGYSTESVGDALSHDDPLSSCVFAYIS